MMKRLFVCFIFSYIFIYHILAQISISGVVTDEYNEALPYATIRLYDNSTLLKGVCADSTGYYKLFPIAKGKYRIDANYVGSADSIQSCIIVKDTTINIILKTNHINLNEVVVRGTKPIIKREIDRLVFNVENSPISQGNNIMDLLRQTPLVKVTDNSIGIIGKSSVKIMLNGKMSYLDSGDLVQYLKSLQSDDVASIEVITTPPSKYDAGGNGGLINIVTKRKLDIGWNGSVGLSYIQRTYAGENANASLNYRSSNSFLSIKIRQNRNAGLVNEEYSIQEPFSEQQSITSRVDTYKNIGGNMTFEHQLSPCSTIGVVYDYRRGKDNIDITNNYQYKSSNELDSVLYTKSLQEGTTIAHTANFYYGFKIDSLGKRLGLVANYMHHQPDKEVNFTTINQETNKRYTVKEPNNISYAIYTGEANLELPFSSFKIETGIKYSDITNQSDMKYYNIIDSRMVEDSRRSNQFNYNEKTLAGYISANKPLSSLLTLQAGLRYEHTYVKGFTPHSDLNEVRTNYGNFFPTVYLTYKPNSSNHFHVNYARRINRPYFRALNPFKWYTNPNNIDEGNPALKPSFADNVELGYVFMNNLSATVYYQKEDNAYGQVLSVSEDNTTYSTYKNIYNNKQIGANLSYSLNVFKWWNIYLAGNYIYNKSDVKADGYIAQNGRSFDYKINNTISLDRDRRFQLFLNYMQNMPYRVGITYDKSYASFSVGLKCAFLNDNLMLNFYGNDLFKQDLVKREKKSVANRQIYHNYYDSRYFRLSVVYKWGNKKIKSHNKNLQFNELKRI